MPDAARGVTVAEDLGWTADEWEPVVRSLGQLVAGVFACGSINWFWVPTWAPDSTIATHDLTQALKTVGVGVTNLDREPKADGDDRADELRPQDHA